MLRLLRRLLALAALLALGYVASVPIRIWADARTEDTRPVDAVVVLGAAQYNGTPSAILEARLRKARALYEADVAPVIVTVGGNQPGDRTTEAQAGRAWLTHHRLPTGAVVAVATGSDTQDSLAAVGRLFRARGWHTAVLVTDPWHEFRSKALAGAAGITATSAPVRSGPVVLSRWTQLQGIARESAAYLQWRLTGHSGITGTAPF